MGASASWVGDRFVLWGGSLCPPEEGGGGGCDVGYAYDPRADRWSTLSKTNQPSPRYKHAAVWTGERLLVWGGEHAVNVFNDGASYDPVLDAWEPIPVTAETPSPRKQPTLLWTGREMLVWGGLGPGSVPGALNDGALYDPTTKTWRTISMDGAPGYRANYAAVWTGTEMIVWGGSGCVDECSDGAAFAPATQRWRKLSSVRSPGYRVFHSAVWSGSHVIVWGGFGNGDGGNDSGALYDPVNDTWTPMARAPIGRGSHFAFWTERGMLVWSGGGSVANTFGVPDGAFFKP
ncbi:MAG: hypothetical protein KIT84_39120 [Labilithrix sp.]|nr:hypothetical protein [Labilithrix sp.]MCW5817074.1 hypothetical protein [Labilithrix sp.]